MYGTIVAPSSISPICRCDHASTTIFFKLRRPDDVTVSILNGRKDEVALLVERRLPRGPVALKWSGRTDENARTPDGTYHARIHLSGQHQTIDLPNPIRVDTKAPQVLSAQPNRDLFSPDGDHQADFVRIDYALTKPAHLELFLGGSRVLYAQAHAVGTVRWYGTDGNGATLKQGQYTLTVGATDLSGNSTPVAQRARMRVEVRFIELASARIVARAGRRFGSACQPTPGSTRDSTPARCAASPLLRSTAPTAPSRYPLTVEERGHFSRAAVTVR